MNKADELFEMLQAAYLRGANWLKENGSDEGLNKAAYDYADYHTSPLTIAERSARIMSAIEQAGVGVETVTHVVPQTFDEIVENCLRIWFFNYDETADNSAYRVAMREIVRFVQSARVADAEGRNS